MEWWCLVFAVSAVYAERGPLEKAVSPSGDLRAVWAVSVDSAFYHPPVEYTRIIQEDDENCNMARRFGSGTETAYDFSPSRGVDLTIPSRLPPCIVGPAVPAL